MKNILALDQGTTSSRAILFDHAGASNAHGRAAYWVAIESLDENGVSTLSSAVPIR
jgi:glycerol kinase